MNALEPALVAAAALAALAFCPWSMLRAPALRGPWVAAMVLLPALWGAQAMLPGGFPARLSGACLLVLMFGWPLAVLTLLPAAAAGAWLGGGGLAQATALAVWDGVVPATLALAAGIASRRWLPRHLFVFILARGFLATALAVGAAALLRVGLAPAGGGGDQTLILTAHWLIAWGEAFMTGALTAIFVAFRPQWLLTWSDERYLPPPVT